MAKPLSNLRNYLFLYLRKQFISSVSENLITTTVQSTIIQPLQTQKAITQEMQNIMWTFTCNMTYWCHEINRFFPFWNCFSYLSIFELKMSSEKIIWVLYATTTGELVLCFCFFVRNNSIWHPVTVLQLI